MGKREGTLGDGMIRMNDWLKGRVIRESENVELSGYQEKEEKYEILSEF